MKKRIAQIVFWTGLGFGSLATGLILGAVVAINFARDPRLGWLTVGAMLIVPAFIAFVAVLIWAKDNKD